VCRKGIDQRTEMLQTCEKTVVLFLSFPCVYPEPVLLN
jgi:hypothetical protein